MGIYLRELIKEDVQIINRWRSNKDLTDLLVSPKRFVGIETDQKWFDNYLNNRPNNIRLGICKHENNMLIGAVYLLSIDWISRSGELGIWIGEVNEQGKGYGENATRQLLKHAFTDLNLKRIYLTVLDYNERAWNLYKRIGFQDEGRLRKAVYKNGSYIDLIQMAILSEDVNTSTFQL